MKKIIFTILFSLLTLSGVTIAPISVNAQFATYEVGNNKEYFLDTIVYALGEVAVQVVTNDIVNWINTGFRGNPAFIQDLGGFFTNISDSVAAGIFQGLSSGILYGPFSRDIRYIVETGYYRSTSNSLADRFSFKPSSKTRGLNAFAQGDFNQGGFRNWYNLTVNPQYNPYAVTFGLQQEIATQVAGAVQRETTVLGFGNGFLSKRECLQGEKPPQCTGPIVTPGEVISNQLENALGLSFGRLTVADEISEIVGSLLGQVVQQALGGAGGLLGSSSSQGGRPPITSNNGTGNIPGVNQNDLLQKIATNTQDTVDYTAIVQGSIGLLQESQTAIADALSCWQDLKPNDPITTQLIAMNASTTDQMNTLQEKLNTANQQLQKLQRILLQIKNAQTEEEAAAAERNYNNLQGLVTKTDITVAQAQNKQLGQDTKKDIAFANQKKQDCKNTTTI